MILVAYFLKQNVHFDVDAVSGDFHSCHITPFTDVLESLYIGFKMSARNCFTIHMTAMELAFKL